MRKFSWIIALLAALAMVFVGISCSDGGGSGPKDKEDPVDPGNVTPPVTTKYLQFYDRTQNWHTLDIHGGMGFNAAGNDITNYYNEGKAHTFEITGKSWGGVASNLFLQGAESSGAGGSSAFPDLEGDEKEKNPDGTFYIKQTFPWETISRDNNIRVSQFEAPLIHTLDFYEIVITDEDGHVVYKLSTDPDVQDKEDGYEILKEGVGGVPSTVTTWLHGALGGDTIGKARVVVPKATQEPEEYCTCTSADCACECEGYCNDNDCPDCMPQQADSFTVQIGATADDTATILASAVKKNGGITATVLDTGFVVGGSSHDRGKFVSFAIDLGDKTLSDYASISYDYTGLSGDYNYKPNQIYAANPTPGLTNAALTSAITRVTESGNVSANVPKNLVFPIYGSRVTTLGLASDNIVEIGIFIPANATEIRISNIKFNLGANTPDEIVSIIAIQGVTQPIVGDTPATGVNSTTQYTGTVSWSPDPGATFASGYTGTATITLTATQTYTLTGVASNFFTVEGATSVTNPASSGVITAVFPVAVSLGALEEKIVLDESTYNTTAQFDGITIWDWCANDGMGLKGRLTADFAAAIMAYSLGGEIRLTIVKPDNGNAISNGGNGSFGGADINCAGGEGPENITIPISSISTMGAADGRININLYNSVKISKIEVWAPEE